MELSRWKGLMTGLGLGPSLKTFSALEHAYAEKGRAYHGAEHIRACLRHLDRCAAQLDAPLEVELALWFHDAIYRPLRGNNEEASADWAASFLEQGGASTERVALVRRLILVTRHDAPIQSKDEGLIVDIDLAILGASPQVYARFEGDVRAEYRWVPGFLYRKKRAEILQGFLERPRIFTHEPFYSEREGQAKENLAWALGQLTAGGDG